MKPKILLSLTLFLLSTRLFAVSIVGGSVTYRYLGNQKYELTFKAYRDCRGISLSSINASIACGTGGSGSKSLSLTRVSIKDITYTCAKVGVICNPANTTISSSEPAIEEHTFLDTIDFGGSESSFASCATVAFGMGNCCRNGSITTGAAGSDQWIITTLELSKAKGNSSPLFKFAPQVIVPANQPLYWDLGASDADNDSLSYSFTDPRTSWSGKTSWSGNHNSQTPFTDYYPGGYDKSKGPKPENNPPIGTYLDPISGLLSVTPIDASEVTVMAVAVKEWRKDSSGKYRQIGEVVRDIHIIVKTVNNNSPTFSGGNSYSLCAGEKFTLDIYTSDKSFILPPPAKPIANDTVKLSWFINIPNAILNLDTTYVKQQAARFTWTPTASDARGMPYIITLIASDNACPMKAVSMKLIKLYVYPKIKVSSTITQQSKSEYAYQVDIDNKSYQYFVANSVKTTLPYDDRAFYFKSTKRLDSDKLMDTILFKKNGRFILNHFFASAIACNTRTVSDTIDVQGVFDVSVSYFPDTAACKNEVTRFNAVTHYGQRPITYTWKGRTVNQTDTLGYLERSYDQPDTISLLVKDATGKSNSTYFYVGIKSLPSIWAGPDKITCPGISQALVAKNLNKDTLAWNWTYKGTVLSSRDTLNASQPGTYLLKAVNRSNCVAFDTVNIENFVPRQVALKSGKYCQDKNELKQTEIFESSSHPDKFPQLIWTLQRSIRKPDGNANTLNNLLTDLDNSEKYNYRIRFDKTLVDVALFYKDSLRFAVQAWDSNGCISNSSMNVVIIRRPVIEFGFHSFGICRNDSLDLTSKVLTEGVSTWTTANRAGYASWPQTGILANGLLLPNAVGKAGGKFFVKLTSLNEFCPASDSIDVIINPLPLPVISRLTFGDSVKYTDNSLYSSSRKWFLDNLPRGTQKQLGFTKIEGEGKELRLELSNANCSTDTVFTVKTLGIQPLQNSFVKIFPNPASNRLIVEQLKPMPGGRYEIFNHNGQLLLRDKLYAGTTAINLETLPAGIYRIRLSSEGYQGSFSFLKVE